MSANKKQRHNRKRQEKRRALQRATAGTPYRIIGRQGTIESCYINKDWRNEGMAAIIVLKRVGSGYVMGCFLIDLFCMGLKDAWGKIDIGPVSFKETIQDYSQRITLTPVSPSLALNLVMGGVRIAKENGFRLPPRYERWIPILGDPSAYATADLSSFRKDGKLFYIGTIDQLRKRLIGCTLDKFMAREDVSVTFVSNPEDYLLDDEGFYEDDQELEQRQEKEEQLEENVTQMRKKILNAARRWLFSQSMEPHPRLSEALDLVLESIIQTPLSEEETSDENSASNEHIDRIGRGMEQFLSLETDESGAELTAALGQLSRFIKQFKTQEDMLEAVESHEQKEPE